MKILLLMNPASRGGRGKRLWPEIFAALERAAIDYRLLELERIEDAYEAASKCTGYDAVAAVGGDGTVNAAGGGVLNNPDPELKFAVLYTGTSPDFCRFHHIPLRPADAVGVIKDNFVREIPVLQANGRPFFCSCNLGIGAEVASGANRLRPLLGDNAGTLLALLSALLRNRRSDYFLSDGREILSCNHLLITRMPYIAGGLKIDLPELHDNEYAIWYLRGRSRPGMLKLIPGLYFGKAQGEIIILKEDLRIGCLEARAVEYDGDPHGVMPLNLSWSPRRLKLLCGKEKNR